MPPPRSPYLFEAELKLKDSFLDVLDIDGALPHSPGLPFELLDVGKWPSLSLIYLNF